MFFKGEFTDRASLDKYFIPGRGMFLLSAEHNKNRVINLNEPSKLSHIVRTQISLHGHLLDWL